MSAEGLIRAEDLPVGEELALGTYHVTRAELVDFAERWDPQGFHVDVRVAAATVFGDLIGSGLHTMAIFQRLAVLGAYRRWAIVAGRGVRNIELTSPLRPDTTVRAAVEITSVEPISDERSRVAKTGRVVHGERVLLTSDVESYVLRPG